MIRLMLNRFCAPFAASLLLVACGGGGDDVNVDDSQPTVVAFGKASLGSGLSGAALEVQDLDGKLPQSLDRNSQANGTFVIHIPTARIQSFRLVAKGGTYAGRAFNGELMADFDGTDPKLDLYYANAVTTLAARTRDRHPELTVGAASNRVKRFLGIPQTSAIGFDVSNPKQTYFSAAKLLSAASTAGVSFDVYVERLIDEMDGGVAQHIFVSQSLSIDSSDITKFLKNAAEKLGEDLVGDLVSWGFESVLTELGISTDAEILEQLHEINAKLDQLNLLVTDVLSEEKQTQTDLLAGELLKAVNLIQLQYKFLTFAAEAGQIACILDPVSKLPVDATCASNRAGLQTSVQEHIDSILNSDNGVVADVALITTVLISSPGDEGLFKSYDAYLKTTSPFYSSKPNPKLQALNAYYEGLQLMGTQLIMEALMGRDPPDRLSAGYALDNLNAAMTAQDKAIADLHAPVPAHADSTTTMLDTRTGLTWQQAPISHFWNDGVLHFYDRAAGYCERESSVSSGGYSKWRLPTDPELHAVVKGSPNPTGNADGGAGIFKWLGNNRFNVSGDGGLEVYAFVVGTAYLSSTISGTSGYYHEALRDTGVDFTWSDTGGPEEYNIGAWCVTDETVPPPAGN